MHSQFLLVFLTCLVPPCSLFLYSCIFLLRLGIPFAAPFSCMNTCPRSAAVLYWHPHPSLPVLTQQHHDSFFACSSPSFSISSMLNLLRSPATLSSESDASSSFHSPLPCFAFETESCLSFSISAETSSDGRSFVWAVSEGVGVLVWTREKRRVRGEDERGMGVGWGDWRQKGGLRGVEGRMLQWGG